MIFNLESGNPPGAQDHPFYRKVSLPFELPTAIYTGMLVVWMQRSQLQSRFPLYRNRREDYLYFLAWCFSTGRKHYKILSDNTAWNDELNKPFILPKIKDDRWPGVYTVGMYLLGIFRSRYIRAQFEGSARRRNETAEWYFREGFQILGLSAVPPWQADALKACCESYENFLGKLVCRSKPDSQRTTLESNCPFANIWEVLKVSKGNLKQDARRYSPSPYLYRILFRYLPLKIYIINVVRRALGRKREKPSFEQLSQISRLIPIDKVEYFRKEKQNKVFGVNLIGYAKGELGIGEDVRTVAAALKSVGIPIGIINVPLPDSVSQKDSSLDSYISHQQSYSINLFCMTGIETVKYIAENGLNRLYGFYNIGLWPWELERWPSPLRYCYNVVDELWGISSFVSRAYRDALVPVMTVPMPVDVSNKAAYNREYWGIPESSYMFVFSFDMNSTFKRKNPEAVVDAFLAAFPKQAESVGLVLKVSHLMSGDKAWQKLLVKINRDSRIKVISKELRKEEVISLYSCCDCYVSLHRSEGFGRSIAESILLGLDVVTTNYSGNTDFCDDQRVAKIPFLLRKLSAGDYFYGDGQYWAEVDPEFSKNAMLEMAYGNLSGEYTSKFDFSYCGSVYLERLKKLRRECV